MAKNHPKTELLAPAGNMEKLQTALHFGADAVYFSGKKFGLRAFAGNFTDEEIFAAARLCHASNAKAYVTLNVFASEADFDELESYLKLLEEAGVDAVIVSDAGVFDFVKERSNLCLHLSTQANTTNKYAVRHWANLGAQRVVLAREIPLKEISGISKFCPDVQLEAFVHGAMCVSYSGRCLLSNYLCNRNANRGECVQACRWEWQVREVSRDDWLPVYEDERGTYIFNSKDMNMLSFLPQMTEAGVSSFKIEGRMKSSFYVATVVAAYRRALDAVAANEFTPELAQSLQCELNKASHRDYTTGFYFDEDCSRQYYESSKAVETYKFVAVVKSVNADGTVTVELRNKFAVGDVLEVLTATPDCGKSFEVQFARDEEGNSLEVCNRVKQSIVVNCPYVLSVGDILRRRND